MHAKISTQADVREFKRLFEYRDGVLYWKVRASNCIKVGSAAGGISGCGYLQVRICGKNFYVHRIIWEMHCGPIIKDMQIDHINQVRTDNRIENLRLVSREDNSRNRTRQGNNNSGTTGIYWYKGTGKWRAGIKVDGKYKSLGYFSDFEAAVAARKAAETVYGFHENHGSVKK